MNYKNAYEELKRLYEKLEQEKYKIILDSNGLINVNGMLQQENARLKDKNKKALELLQILHHNFPDYDYMHKRIEDIEEILKEN